MTASQEIDFNSDVRQAQAPRRREVYVFAGIFLAWLVVYHCLVPVSQTQHCTGVNCPTGWAAAPQGVDNVETDLAEPILPAID